MADYIQPPTLYTGQVLGKANLSLYVDNDYYFSGLADRWRCIPTGEMRGFIGNEPDITLWEGYHLLTDDAKTLRYYIGADGSATNTVTVTLYYDGVLVDSVVDAGVGWTYKESTYSLSAKSPGLYYVKANLHRSDGWQAGYGICRAPGTYYTGGSSYTTPPTITDGNTGLASDFNTWRANDIYFATIMPPQPAFAGMGNTFIAGGLTRDLYYGWDKYHPDHKRIYYSVWLNVPVGDTKNNRVVLYYDTETKTLTTDGWNIGYWDLSGSYTKGNFYMVYAQLVRDGTSYTGSAEVRYLYITGASQDADFTNMGEFAVDQYVYGSTAGQGTRLSLLSANDAAIYDRLTWGDGSNYAKMHWAVKIPTFGRLGGTDTGDFFLVHRYDLLYYRTEGATLYWGSDSQSLEDYGGDSYKILDLTSLNIPKGVGYRIAGDTLHFAAEMP